MSIEVIDSSLIIAIPGIRKGKRSIQLGDYICINKKGKQYTTRTRPRKNTAVGRVMKVPDEDGYCQIICF